MLLLALLPCQAAAQDTLSLADALSLARQHNPDYQKAINDRDAASISARAGWAWFLPSLTASMGFNGSSNRNVTGQDIDGQPIDLPQPVSFRSSSASQGISASLTLFDGLRSLRTARAAGAAQDAADARVNAEDVRIAAAVSRQFYRTLQQRTLIALEQRLLQSAQDQLTATQRLFRTAGANQVDVLGAQVAVAQQEQALAQQQGEAAKAGLELARLLGVDDISAIVPAGEPPDPFDPSPIEISALVARAERESPQVAQLAANATAANAQAGAAHGSRWPTINLNASLGRSIGLSSYGALGELNPKNRSFGFGISMQLPLFTRFQNSANIASANARADNADQDLRAGRLQLEAQVRSGYVDLQNAWRASVLADRSAELSRTRLELAQEQYRLGAIRYQDLQQVIDRTAQAERQAVAGRYGFAAALVAIEELVGGEVRP